MNSGKRTPASINLGLAHFPPLNAQEKSQGQKVSQNLKKLSKSDIVAVIKALGEPCKPKFVFSLLKKNIFHLILFY